MRALAAAALALFLPACALHMAVLKNPEGKNLGRLYTASIFRRDRAASRFTQGSSSMELCLDDEAVSGNATVGAIGAGALAGSLAGPVGAAAGAGAAALGQAAANLTAKVQHEPPAPFWCFEQPVPAPAAK